MWMVCLFNLTICHNFQQTIVGSDSSCCVQCSFAYSWKGSCSVCHWEFITLSGGSTKRWAPACWCMELTPLPLFFSHYLKCNKMFSFNIRIWYITIAWNHCRFHFSLSYSAWMLIIWLSYLQLCCLKDEFCSDQTSMYLLSSAGSSLINAVAITVCHDNSLVKLSYSIVATNSKDLYIAWYTV